MHLSSLQISACLTLMCSCFFPAFFLNHPGLGLGLDSIGSQLTKTNAFSDIQKSGLDLLLGTKKVMFLLKLFACNFTDVWKWQNFIPMKMHAKTDLFFTLG